ncbi:MAG: CsgG/HfaB family protein [Spirochaetales bacterium]|nr:CsgG/HfaB family protein [Spirochaetales bacterium]
MNNTKLKLSIAIIVMVMTLMSGCAGIAFTNSDVIYGIDSLVSEIAYRAVEIIPSESDVSMAVYYFTVDGKESKISDYLITGITTEIANLSGDRTTMVSRQGLDRVMSEYSFRVSDLVSEETQVDIGELLGADIILIGFINPLEEYDKINIQLLDVETGAVLGGFFLDYILETGFSRDGSSSVVVLGDNTLQVSGVSTITTVYEDFEGSVTRANPIHFEEFWGERILSASARTGTDDDGYGFLDFNAEFDNLDMLNGWDDSDLTFYLTYKTDWIPLNQTGLAMDIYPEDFSRITLVLQQADGDNLKTFIAPVTVTPDEWNKFLVPFDSFKDAADLGVLDTEKPVIIGFGVPFLDNYSSFYFRDGLYLEKRLRVDNLGFFKLKESDPPGLIDAFEDEVVRAPALFVIGGSGLYVDYTDSDEGVLKENEGLEWQYIETSVEEDGPAGNFLRLFGELELNEQILDYFEDDQSLYVVYRLSTGLDWNSLNNLSLLIRSELFENCYVEIIGNGTDQYYSSSFNLNSSWSSIKVPYSDIITDNGSLDEIPLETEQVWLSLVFTIPEASIEEAVEYGSLDFEINIDQIVLQE